MIKCAQAGCIKRASQGTIIGHPAHCAEHKLLGMRSVVCQYPGCTYRPFFAREGATKGEFCAEHKSSDMVYVSCKRIQHPRTYAPSFTREGATKGEFRVEHKAPNIVYVNSKRRQHPTYTYTLSFARKGATGGKFCTEHKLPERQHAKCSESSRFHSEVITIEDPMEVSIPDNVPTDPDTMSTLHILADNPTPMWPRI